MEIYGERENDRESIRSYLKNILDPFFLLLKNIANIAMGF